MKKALTANTILILLEVIGMIVTWQNNHFWMFCFYTQDSNLILLIVALFYEKWLLQQRKKARVSGEADGDPVMPRPLYLAKYLATCLVTVTFIVVIFILAPMGFSDSYEHGMEILLGNANLYLHLACPILGILSFIFLDPHQPLGIRANLLALIPTALYAAVSLALNIARVVHGPYPFLYVYEQPVYMSVFWCALILSAAYLLAYLIRWAAGKIRK